MLAASATASYPSLAGRTVFVSGGGSGIGADLVRRFAEQGCRVAFCDIADEPSRALAAQLAPADVRYHHCDLHDMAVLRATLAAVEAVTPGTGTSVAVNLRHHFLRRRRSRRDGAAGAGDHQHGLVVRCAYLPGTWRPIRRRESAKA
jgi:NAD(P)-dependent dehydrogenase (short-subunit alcohol dehydrogenase family)